ncbi:MAG TPA: HPr-rel-A system PqqD family peptide chaperone [Sphingobium sp.]
MAQGLYRAEPASDYILRALDDVTLVYHRRSGQTHIVVSPVPEILAVLADGAGSADDMLARLSRDYDLGDPGEALAAVEANLDELAALGLAHRA